MNIVLTAPHLFGFNTATATSYATKPKTNSTSSPDPDESYPTRLSQLAIGSRGPAPSLRSSRLSAANLQTFAADSNEHLSIATPPVTINSCNQFDSRDSLSGSGSGTSLSTTSVNTAESADEHSTSYPSSSHLSKIMGASTQRKGCAFCGALQAINGGPLSRCKQCNMTAYCGEEHQNFDWKRHKPLCKTIQSQLSRNTHQSPPVQFHLYTPNSPPRIYMPTPGSAVQKGVPAISRLSESSCNSIYPTVSPPHVEMPVTMNGAQNPSTSSNTSHSLPTRWITNHSTPSAFTTVPSSSPETSSALGAGGAGVVNSRSPNHIVDTSDPDIQIIENTAVAVMRPQRIARKRPQLAVDKRQMKDHSKNTVYKTTLQEHLKQLTTTGLPINQHQAIALRLKNIGEHVIKSLNEYGWAVVDNFLGSTHCRHTYQEMEELYRRGLFSAGQLMDKKDGSQSQDIRSDEIYWFDSSDERAQDAVTNRLLVSMIDSVIVHFAGRVPYKISGRSRAMIAVYPGNGTRYVKHVDNPVKDGRCITTIYYCNENWNVNEHGGALRLYPETSAVPMDIDPQGDRLVFFWSDRRNPHEVMPVFRFRYALTIWYFDQSEKTAALERRRKEEIAKNISVNNDALEFAKRETEAFLNQTANEVAEPPVTKPKVEDISDDVPRTSVDTCIVSSSSLLNHQSVICSANPGTHEAAEARVTLNERRQETKEQRDAIRTSTFDDVNGHDSLCDGVSRSSFLTKRAFLNRDSSFLPDEIHETKNGHHLIRGTPVSPDQIDFSKLNTAISDSEEFKKLIFGSLPDMNEAYRTMLLNRQYANYSSESKDGVPSTSSGDFCPNSAPDGIATLRGSPFDTKPERKIIN